MMNTWRSFVEFAYVFGVGELGGIALLAREMKIHFDFGIFVLRFISISPKFKVLFN